MNNKSIERKPNCTCGKECVACSAEKLSVDCGCDMEAKQFESNMDHSCCHDTHDKKPVVAIAAEVSMTPSGEDYYTCPMHPEVRSKVPGKCPGCGMDLILKKAAVSAHGDHAGHEHDMHDMQKMSHMDHEAAMTSPQMAKQMEKDMRRRFWISFLLSIPIFLYSPVGTAVFKVALPSPIPINWLLLILTTPIVFWCGSIFITGTYYSLKAKKLNMAVLIATGVLAAYLFSVLLTIIGSPDTFYEAAALLVTFVLFGHWMEMK